MYNKKIFIELYQEKKRKCWWNRYKLTLFLQNSYKTNYQKQFKVLEENCLTYQNNPSTVERRSPKECQPIVKEKKYQT